MSVIYLYIRSTSNLSLMQHMRLYMCWWSFSNPLFWVSSSIWILLDSPPLTLSWSKYRAQYITEHGVMNTRIWKISLWLRFCTLVGLPKPPNWVHPHLHVGDTAQAAQRSSTRWWRRPRRPKHPTSTIGDAAAQSAQGAQSAQSAQKQHRSERCLPKLVSDALQCTGLPSIKQ